MKVNRTATVDLTREEVKEAIIKLVTEKLKETEGLDVFVTDVRFHTKDKQPNDYSIGAMILNTSTDGLIGAKCIVIEKEDKTTIAFNLTNNT